MKKTFYKTDQSNPAVQAYKKAVEVGMKSQHVFPRDDVWVVKRADTSKVTRIFDTQEEAQKFALAVAQNQKTSLFVYGKDGKIRDRKYF